MTHYTLDEAQEVQFGATEIRRRVKPGDTVQISEQWVATITQDALDCDCGKGVLCPLNPQTPVEAGIIDLWAPLRYHVMDPYHREWCLTCGDLVPGESPTDHLIRTAYRPTVRLTQ